MLPLLTAIPAFAEGRPIPEWLDGKSKPVLVDGGGIRAPIDGGPIAGPLETTTGACGLAFAPGGAAPATVEELSTSTEMAN